MTTERERAVRLTEEAKEELALALVLWKDFKCGGRFDTGIAIQMLKLADHLGVRKQTEAMLHKLPPVRFTSRFVQGDNDARV